MQLTIQIISYCRLNARADRIFRGALKQMEKELDHFVANHERAATLAERLPLLLQRARQ